MDRPWLTIINIIIMYQDFTHGLTDSSSHRFCVAGRNAWPRLLLFCLLGCCLLFLFLGFGDELIPRDELVTPFMIYCRTI